MARALQSFNQRCDLNDNIAAKVDWVKARSLCSLPNIFKTLRIQVEEDVKAHNALRPDNSPYEFSVKETA